MGVLDETQKQRDIELAGLLKVPIEKLCGQVVNPKAICLFDPESSDGIPVDWSELYSSFKHLDPVKYFRMQMYTSVTRRGEVLLNLLRKTKGKVCLDYGCGTATHAIALLENGNKVSILEVAGPILDFAVNRIMNRDFVCPLIYLHDSILPEGKYDLIICTNVLEHIQNPMAAVKSMYRALKVGGKLFVDYSQMVKPSGGHFSSSINVLNDELFPFLNKRFTLQSQGVYVKHSFEKNMPCKKGKNVPISEITHYRIFMFLTSLGVNSVVDMGGCGKFRSRVSLNVTDANLENGIDGTNLPYEDDSFDASVSIATLEHVADKIAFIKEAVRVARMVSVHWFPAGDMGKKLEEFLIQMGHPHKCSGIPDMEDIKKFLDSKKLKFSTEPHQTIGERLLCLATMNPQLNTDRLYSFISEYGSYPNGEILTIHNPAGVK